MYLEPLELLIERSRFYHNLSIDLFAIKYQVDKRGGSRLVREQSLWHEIQSSLISPVDVHVIQSLEPHYLEVSKVEITGITKIRHPKGYSIFGQRYSMTSITASEEVLMVELDIRFVEEFICLRSLVLQGYNNFLQKMSLLAQKTEEMYTAKLSRMLKYYIVNFYVNMSMPKVKYNKSIAIIGGSFRSILLAQQLRQFSFQVTIFECGEPESQYVHYPLFLNRKKTAMISEMLKNQLILKSVPDTSKKVMVILKLICELSSSGTNLCDAFNNYLTNFAATPEIVEQLQIEFDQLLLEFKLAGQKTKIKDYLLHGRQELQLHYIQGINGWQNKQQLNHGPKIRSIREGFIIETPRKMPFDYIIYGLNNNFLNSILQTESEIFDNPGFSPQIVHQLKKLNMKIEYQSKVIMRFATRIKYEKFAVPLTILDKTWTCLFYPDYLSNGDGVVVVIQENKLVLDKHSNIWKVYLLNALGKRLGFDHQLLVTKLLSFDIISADYYVSNDPIAACIEPYPRLFLNLPIHNGPIIDPVSQSFEIIRRILLDDDGRQVVKKVKAQVIVPEIINHKQNLKIQYPNIVELLLGLENPLIKYFMQWNWPNVPKHMQDHLNSILSKSQWPIEILSYAHNYKRELLGRTIYISQCEQQIQIKEVSQTYKDLNDFWDSINIYEDIGDQIVEEINFMRKFDIVTRLLIPSLQRLRQVQYERPIQLKQEVRHQIEQEQILKTAEPIIIHEVEESEKSEMEKVIVNDAISEPTQDHVFRKLDEIYPNIGDIIVGLENPLIKYLTFLKWPKIPENILKHLNMVLSKINSPIQLKEGGFLRDLTKLNSSTVDVTFRNGVPLIDRIYKDSKEYWEFIQSKLPVEVDTVDWIQREKESYKKFEIVRSLMKLPDASGKERKITLNEYNK